MNSSKRWDDKWKALKERGIDGFAVGVPPDEHPGPVYWDIVCDMCGVLIKKNDYSLSELVYCEVCRNRIKNSLNSFRVLNASYETVSIR